MGSALTEYAATAPARTRVSIALTPVQSVSARSSLEVSPKAIVPIVWGRTQPVVANAKVIRHSVPTQRRARPVQKVTYVTAIRLSQVYNVMALVNASASRPRAAHRLPAILITESARLPA